LVWTF